MYQGCKIIALVPAFNEENKIGRVIERTDLTLVDTLLVIDDCSTDSTASVARSHGAEVLTLKRRRGVGAALRSGFDYARGGGYDIAVIMAGNNKDDPSEIRRLLDPICENKKDFVIGSRYMAGGGCGGDMPLHRRFATRFHPWLLGKLSSAKLTESTNGFRAIRLTILDDPRINLNQRWLDAYGLEVYTLWMVLTLGYEHAEVPCTKTYPPRSSGYTKMVPIISWWSILRPMLLLRLGLRR
jgi:dolichol-phosphate mannosyltransferase